MKKIVFLSMVVVFANNFILAQSSKKFSDDEIARMKFSVHLITYDTISAFDNAQGEAYYKMLIQSFCNNLIIPGSIPADLTPYDRNKIEKIIQQLKDIRQNPLTWKNLYEQETQYLIWLDKVTRRHTKYKVQN